MKEISTISNRDCSTRGCSQAAHAFAYLNDADGSVRGRLADLGCGRIVLHPARPPESGGAWIYDHLCAPLAGREEETTSGEGYPPSLLVDRESVDAARRRWRLPARGPYALLHPGSGGRRKNWPPERFAILGSRLARRMAVVVTAGEADGDIGRRVAEGISNARLVENGTLADDLLPLLAGAEVYIGNDSGVSHLAAAAGVADASGSPVRAPRCLVLFGPTDPALWRPPGAMVLRAPGGDLAALDPERVWKRLSEEGRRLFPEQPA